jgi:hypothetical protein
MYIYLYIYLSIIVSSTIVAKSAMRACWSEVGGLSSLPLVASCHS